jgi:hypothetical protein
VGAAAGVLPPVVVLVEGDAEVVGVVVPGAVGLAVVVPVPAAAVGVADPDAAVGPVPPVVPPAVVGPAEPGAGVPALVPVPVVEPAGVDGLLGSASAAGAAAPPVRFGVAAECTGADGAVL